MFPQIRAVRVIVPFVPFVLRDFRVLGWERPTHSIAKPPNRVVFVLAVLVVAGHPRVPVLTERKENGRVGIVAKSRHPKADTVVKQFRPDATIVIVPSGAGHVARVTESVPVVGPLTSPDNLGQSLAAGHVLRAKSHVTSPWGWGLRSRDNPLWQGEIGS